MSLNSPMLNILEIFSGAIMKIRFAHHVFLGFLAFCSFYGTGQAQTGKIEKTLNINKKSTHSSTNLGLYTKYLLTPNGNTLIYIEYDSVNGAKIFAKKINEKNEPILLFSQSKNNPWDNLELVEVSENSKTLIFAEQNPSNTYKVYAVSINGHNEAILLNTNFYNSYSNPILLSPNGKTVVIDDKSYSIGEDKTEIHTLSSIPPYDTYTPFRPKIITRDSKNLIFQEYKLINRLDDYGLYIIPLDGKQPRTLLSGNDYGKRFPSALVSPNGKSLVYSDDRYINKIYSISLDEISEPIVLSNPKANPFNRATPVSLTHNGKSLIFSEEDNYFVVPIDGSEEPKRLSNTKIGYVTPLISPDDRFFVYINNDYDIYVSDIFENSPSRKLSFENGFNSPILITPDSKYLIFRRESGLYSKAFDESKSYRFIAKDTSQVLVSNDSKTVVASKYIFAENRSFTQLYSFDIDGDKKPTLLSLGRDWVYIISLANNGKSVIFSEGENIIMRNIDGNDEPVFLNKGIDPL